MGADGGSHRTTELDLKQFIPNWPKTIQEAIALLKYSLEEQDEYKKNEFVVGYQNGLRMAIGVMKDVQRNYRWWRFWKRP